MAKNGNQNTSWLLADRCPCVNMVFLYNEDSAPEVCLRYAAELANACNLPWTEVRGSYALKKTVRQIPETYDYSACVHQSPLQAYQELKRLLPGDKDPFRFVPCAFCRNPCSGARNVGTALDKGHNESLLLSYIIMNFDLLVPDLESLRKSTTREWFFSLFKMRRQYCSTYGNPSKGDVLSFPVAQRIAEELYHIYEEYSASAGEMDKELSVPVLSPAFVLSHLENSTDLFSAGLDKKHGGIAEKAAASLRNWFLKWRTTFVLEGLVSADTAAAAFESLSRDDSKKEEIPPFYFNFKKDGLRSRFESSGLTFEPVVTNGKKRNTELQNAVSAENCPMEKSSQASSDSCGDQTDTGALSDKTISESAVSDETGAADAVSENAASADSGTLERSSPQNPSGDAGQDKAAAVDYQAVASAALKAAYGTDDPSKIEPLEIRCDQDAIGAVASQPAAESPNTKQPGADSSAPAKAPDRKRDSATVAGGQAAKSPNVERAATIANEIKKTESAETPGTGSAGGGKSEPKKDSMSTLFGAVPAGSATSKTEGDTSSTGAAAGLSENAGAEPRSERKPAPRPVREEELTDIELPCFDNLDFIDPASSGFNERGAIDLSDFDILDYGFFIPDLSDWWFRMIGASDTVCVEPAERDGEPGLLFFCYGMEPPEGSVEPNKPFFISDSDMFRSVDYTSFHHRIFDMGNRTFYTFHKPEIVSRLRSKWNYSIGQLDGKILSMQPLLVCSYGSLRLADMETLASGSKNRNQLFSGNSTLNIFKAYPDLYAEILDSLITNNPGYGKQVRWFQAFECALGTAYAVSRFCNIAEPNLVRRDAVDCRFRFNRRTRLNYRCLLVGLKFEATKDGEPVEGDLLKYLTALCIGRAFTVTQILGAYPVLLSYRPAEAVFLLPTFGDKQDARMKERLLNAFASFDNSFKSVLRELGFKVGSLQNLYSFGDQILESEVPREQKNGGTEMTENAEPDVRNTAGGAEPAQAAAG